VSRFHGFDLSERQYDTRRFTCNGCPNVCQISEVRFSEQERFYYGARCDRYDERARSRSRQIPDLFSRRESMLLGEDGAAEGKEGMLRYAATRSRKGTIGVPRTLLNWEQFPFFREFLRELGFDVLLSPHSHRNLVRASVAQAPPTACLPVKVVNGHVDSLLAADIDYLFVPAMVDAAHPNTRTPTNFNCPLVQAQPYMIAAQVEIPNRDVKLIEQPLHFYRREMIEAELTALARKLGASPRRAAAAKEAAKNAASSFHHGLSQLGREAMEHVAEGALGIVVLSRVYNSCDPGLSLSVPDKLRALGALPIPVDCLPWQEVDTDSTYPFMQWHAGKRLLAAARIVRETEGLWGLHLTHFNCGPDSFIAHYLKRELQNKPYLTLELDEHSGDAGVRTRLEAYLDSVSLLSREPRSLPAPQPPRQKEEFDRTKKVYLPYMCDHNYALEGALQHFGYQAETLPPPDAQSLTLGRKCSTGGECLPFILTTGDFLKLLHREDFDPQRACLFMATSTGPCRFCHYFSAQSQIFRRMGYDIDFVALEAYNAYTIRDLGTAFRRTAWYGLVSVDLLLKLLWRTRPYEKERGQTNAVYAQALDELKSALREGGRQGLLKALPGIVDRFRQIPVERGQRPLIGIVGEIYVRANSFSNSGLVPLLEELGAEVRVAPTGEWLTYTHYKKQGDTRLRREWKSHLRTRLERYVLRHDEHKAARPFAGSLEEWDLEEPLTERVVHHAEPYISEAYRGEPVLTVGKAIDYAKAGFDGIVNVMPFSCMPGTMVSSVSPQVRHDHKIPWLNLTFDGQEQAHLRTRLEAFVHQALLHKNGDIPL